MEKKSIFADLKERIEKVRKEGTLVFDVERIKETIERIKNKKEGKL